jgi:hypothetical protein
MCNEVYKLLYMITSMLHLLWTFIPHYVMLCTQFTATVTDIADGQVCCADAQCGDITGTCSSGICCLTGFCNINGACTASEYGIGMHDFNVPFNVHYYSCTHFSCASTNIKLSHKLLRFRVGDN